MSGSQFRPNTGSLRKSQYKVKISGSKKVEKQSVLKISKATNIESYLEQSSNSFKKVQSPPDMFNETVFYRDAKETYEEPRLADSPLNVKENRWLNKGNSPGLSGGKQFNSTIGSKFSRSR